jgi:hypothetical protein
VDPKIGLNAVEKNIFYLKYEWSPSRPLHNPSLYRLSYPGAFNKVGKSSIITPEFNES